MDKNINPAELLAEPISQAHHLIVGRQIGLVGMGWRRGRRCGNRFFESPHIPADGAHLCSLAGPRGRNRSPNPGTSPRNHRHTPSQRFRRGRQAQFGLRIHGRFVDFLLRA
jgi:hypothetical protein